MNYILFDGDNRDNLLPFTLTRPVADIRIGILTIREKWNHYLNAITGTATQPYLQEKFPINSSTENILINAAVLPDENLIEVIKKLDLNEKLVYNNTIVAAGFSGIIENTFVLKDCFHQLKEVEYTHPLFMVENIWNIFQNNHTQIENDFKLLTGNRKSEVLSSSNAVVGNGNIFIEKGATVECSIINTSNGPVYIGRDAEVMEGSMIRGPFALCNNSTLKMGAKIYGATTIGPHCKVGGEVNNSVIFAYSNKAHDGFLGNSVIGEWCNLGADSNNSNLKNNYSNVKVWSYSKNNFEDTGLQFCGLFMGDHTKASINTMFNTGSVIGMCSNIFGDSFPPKYVPSFSWGGAHGFDTFDLTKAKEMATRVMSRRAITFSKEDGAIFDHLFQNLK